MVLGRKEEGRIIYGVESAEIKSAKVFERGKAFEVFKFSHLDVIVESVGVGLTGAIALREDLQNLRCEGGGKLRGDMKGKGRYLDEIREGLSETRVDLVDVIVVVMTDMRFLDAVDDVLNFLPIFESLTVDTEVCRHFDIAISFLVGVLRILGDVDLEIVDPEEEGLAIIVGDAEGVKYLVEMRTELAEGFVEEEGTVSHDDDGFQDCSACDFIPVSSTILRGSSPRHGCDAEDAFGEGFVMTKSGNILLRLVHDTSDGDELFEDDAFCLVGHAEDCLFPVDSTFCPFTFFSDGSHGGAREGAFAAFVDLLGVRLEAKGHMKFHTVEGFRAFVVDPAELEFHLQPVHHFRAMSGDESCHLHGPVQ
jgi:hypothetical protein